MFFVGWVWKATSLVSDGSHFHTNTHTATAITASIREVLVPFAGCVGREQRGFTSVTLEHLQDLPRLQVPNIHLRIFAAAHNRFPSSYAETREQAIRYVGVPFVCFDAFGRLGIPKSDGRVLRNGEDELGIRGKLDVRTIWTPFVRNMARMSKAVAACHIGLSSSTRVLRH